MKRIPNLIDSGDTEYLAVWSGTDDTPAAVVADMVVTFTLTTYGVRAVRIHVDTTVSEEWDAIDAVKLLTPLATTPSNSPPDADDDAETIDEDQTATIDVLANDWDDGAVLFISIDTEPEDGYAWVDDNNTPTDTDDDVIRYQPNPDFNGTDSFIYKIKDIFGGEDTATVTVTVTPVNDAPVAELDNGVTEMDEAVEIDVLANDSDAEEDDLTVVSVTDGENGTVVNNNDGTVSYTPDEGYTGPDSFTYVVEDEHGAPTTGQVDVVVYGGEWAVSVVAWSSATEEGTAAQALGQPDTFAAGGGTAWSPAAGGNLEFITVGFTPDAATGVLIRQTGGGGAVRRVELVDGSGNRESVWSGSDPTPAGGVGELILTFPETSYDVHAIRVVVDGGQGAAIDAIRLLTHDDVEELTLTTRSFVAAGTVIQTTYDADIQPLVQTTLVRGQLVQTVENEYDSGALVARTVTDALDRATHITFDANGRITAQTLAYGTANEATTSYVYNAKGRLIELTDPVGNVTSWTYDPAGRELTMTDPLDNTVTRTYDDDGRLASITNRNGLRREFEYDAEDRLIEETWT